MLDVCWVVDDNPSGQRGHGNLKSLESGLSLALREPIEELVPGLKEPYAIARERQGARGPAVPMSDMA